MTNDDSTAWQSVLQLLHASTFRVSLATTGGGTVAIGECFRYPGASRTFVDADVPYSHRSLVEYLGAPPVGASASPATAKQLAARTRERARDRCDHPSDEYQYVGIGLVAALPTDRDRRGVSRIHVALHRDDCGALWSLTLSQCEGSRQRSEQISGAMIQHALADLVACDFWPEPDPIYDRVEVSRY